MSAAIKIQRTLPLVDLDAKRAAFFDGDGHDAAVQISLDAWRQAGEPVVVTVTVERVR